MSKSTFSKVWLITVIALVTLFTSVSIVAYWPIMVNPPEGGSKGTTIQIGSGGTVTTILTELNRVGDLSKELIPKHENLNPSSHQTNEIKYEFSVIWKEGPEEDGASKGSSYEGELNISSLINYDKTPDQGADIDSARGLLEVSFYIVEYNDGIRTETLIENNVITIEFEKQFTIVAIVTLKLPTSTADYLSVKGTEFNIKVTLHLESFDEVVEVEDEKD